VVVQLVVVQLVVVQLAVVQLAVVQLAVVQLAVVQPLKLMEELKPSLLWAMLMFSTASKDQLRLLTAVALSS
jgi:hypothetical protein